MELFPFPFMQLHSGLWICILHFQGSVLKFE
jgi:hypothetical protein